MTVTDMADGADTAPSRSLLGIGAVLTATICWSFGGPLGKAVDASGVVITFWRLWIGTGLFLVLAAARRQLPTLAALRLAAPAGALFGANLCAFFSAINYTTVANALIISALTPVMMLPIGVRVLGERLTVSKIACSLVAVAGVVAAVLVAPGGGAGGGRSTRGDILAVVSLLLWIAYLTATKRARRTIDTLPFLTAVTATAAVAVTPFALLGPYDLGEIDGVGWLWLLLLTIVPGALGHGLVAWAQRTVDATVSTVLMQGEPVGATIAAAVFLDERVTVAQLGAMAVVIAALALLAYREGRERPARVATSTVAPPVTPTGVGTAGNAGEP